MCKVRNTYFLSRIIHKNNRQICSSSVVPQLEWSKLIATPISCSGWRRLRARFSNAQCKDLDCERCAPSAWLKSLTCLQIKRIMNKWSRRIALLQSQMPWRSRDEFIVAVVIINAVKQWRNLVFLDENGFTVSSRVNRWRTEKGESAHVPTTSIRSRNVSCICAIHRTGVIHYETTMSLPWLRTMWEMSSLLKIATITSPKPITTVKLASMDKTSSTKEQQPIVRRIGICTWKFCDILPPVASYIYSLHNYVRLNVLISYSILDTLMKTEPLKLGSSVRRRSLGDLPWPNH